MNIDSNELFPRMWVHVAERGLSPLTALSPDEDTQFI